MINHFGLYVNIPKWFILYFLMHPYEKGHVKMYERIRNLREDKDLLQRELADYLHCSQVAYSRYELGLRDIPTEVLIALARYHKTSTDYLLGITDTKRPYSSRD